MLAYPIVFHQFDIILLVQNTSSFACEQRVWLPILQQMHWEQLWFVWLTLDVPGAGMHIWTETTEFLLSIEIELMQSVEYKCNSLSVEVVNKVCLIRPSL